MSERSSSPGSLPPVTRFPDPRIFQVLGENGIRELLRAFYRLLGQSEIAWLFPSDEAGLVQAADRSALFFVGICGGPALYEEKYGPPRMRMRHQNFPITEESRLVWMGCWKTILERAPSELGFPVEGVESFWEYLSTFSQWMVNTEKA